MKLRLAPINSRPAPIIDRSADFLIALVAAVATVASTAVFLQVLNG